MTTVETLNIEGAVTGDFSKLDDVFDKLIDIGMAQDAVFPIEVDQDGAADTWAELTALEEKINDIDDATVDVESNFDTSATRSSPEIRTSGGRQSMDDVSATDSDILNRQSSSLRGFRDLNKRLQDISNQLDSGIDFDDVDLVTDANPQVNIDAPFGEGTGFAENIRDQMGFLGADDGIEVSDPTTITDLLETGALDGDFNLDAAVEFGDERDDSQRSLLERINNVSLSMSSFYRVVASLLPLIGVIVAALPAVIAGLAALAAAAVSTAVALGAVAGIGLLGIGMQDGQFSMQPIQEELQTLQEDFIEAFAPIGRVLADDVRAFFADIGRLFDRIASRGRVLQQAGDLIRAIGDGLVTYLPGILETVIQLGTMAAPLFGRLLSFFANQNFGQIIGNLINELTPMLAKLGEVIFRAIPGIIQLSKGFLAVTVMVATLLSGIIQLLDWLGPLTSIVGILIGTFAVLYSLASIVSIVRSTINTLNISLANLSLTSLTAAQAVGILISTISLGLAALPAIGALTSTATSSNNPVDTDELSRPSTGSMSGAGSGSGSQTYNYYVNANSRGQGNRQGQALRYGSTYSNGSSQDASYQN